MGWTRLARVGRGELSWQAVESVAVSWRCGSVLAGGGWVQSARQLHCCSLAVADEAGGGGGAGGGAVTKRRSQRPKRLGGVVVPHVIAVG